MNAIPQPEVFSLLDEGDVTGYVEQRLFGDKIDALDAHIERKQALADPTRYSILYLLYEYGEISRRRLADETGRDSNDLQYHLRDLLDANLIAKVPAPEGADGRLTYYRITSLGKQEIASDIEHIRDGNSHKRRFRMLGDPECVDELADDSDRIRSLVIAESEGSDELRDRLHELRERRHSFEAVAADSG